MQVRKYIIIHQKIPTNLYVYLYLSKVEFALRFTKIAFAT